MMPRGDIEKDLIAAAIDGNDGLCRNLLGSKCYHNIIQRSKTVALTRAAERHHYEACRVLLLAGADPNGCLEGFNDSPLMCAIRVNDIPLCGLLLHFKPTITVGMVLYSVKFHYIEIIYLLSRFNAYDDVGEFAPGIERYGIYTHDLSNILKLTVNISPYRSTVGRCYSSLLLTAVKEQDEERCEIMLHHAHPNVCDTRGQSALMHAADTSNLRICKLLLDNGANPDVLDDRGYTALLVALMRLKGKPIARLLLEYNANPLLVIAKSLWICDRERLYETIARSTLVERCVWCIRQHSHHFNKLETEFTLPPHIWRKCFSLGVCWVDEADHIT